MRWGGSPGHERGEASDTFAQKRVCIEAGISTTCDPHMLKSGETDIASLTAVGAKRGELVGTDAGEKKRNSGSVR